MTDEDKRGITECHNALLEKGYSMVRSGEVDMLIIDEFNAAYRSGLLDRAAAEEFLTEKPGSAELDNRRCSWIPQITSAKSSA